MIDELVRLAKRAGVLVPGLLMTYVAINNVFPEINKYLPYGPLSVFVTYVITAYFLTPALLRLIRFLFPPTHVPLYCTTPDGFASDPVNIGIYGTKEEMVLAMGQAGWFVADRRTPHTVFKLGVRLFFKKPYLNAPFSSLYLFGRNQDIGFELPVGGNPRHRHHVRFWAASHTGDPKHLEHLSFWDKLQRSNLSTGRVLWVGAASLDTGLGVIRHNAQLTHMIHQDTNAERDLIVTDLRATGTVRKVRSVPIGKPYRLRNRVINGYLRSDGQMTICELKNLAS